MAAACVPEEMMTPGAAVAVLRRALAPNVDGGVQEMGLGIVFIQLLQTRRVFSGGVVITRVTIRFSQGLEDHRALRLISKGLLLHRLLQLALGSGQIAGLAQHLSQDVVRLGIFRSIVDDVMQRSDGLGAIALTPPPPRV